MDVNSVYNLWEDQTHGKYTHFDISIFGLFLGTNKKYLEQKPDRALWWFRCSGYDNFQGKTGESPSTILTLYKQKGDWLTTAANFALICLPLKQRHKTTPPPHPIKTHILKQKSSRKCSLSTFPTLNWYYGKVIWHCRANWRLVPNILYWYQAETCYNWKRVRKLIQA